MRRVPYLLFAREEMGTRSFTGRKLQTLNIVLQTCASGALRKSCHGASLHCLLKL
jgi:hypothetical protein